MPAILGTDDFRYEIAEDWAKLPPGYQFNADVAAVGVDSRDNVYAFSRDRKRQLTGNYDATVRLGDLRGRLKSRSSLRWRDGIPPTLRQ